MGRPAVKTEESRQAFAGKVFCSPYFLLYIVCSLASCCRGLRPGFPYSSGRGAGDRLVFTCARGTVLVDGGTAAERAGESTAFAVSEPGGGNGGFHAIVSHGDSDHVSGLLN